MPEPAERLRGADAAVVELDPLADPVRPRAEHDDRAGGGLVAVALLVREVVVGRPRLELAGAGVDGEPAGKAAAGPHLRLCDLEQPRDPRVGEPEALRRGDVAARDELGLGRADRVELVGEVGMQAGNLRQGVADSTPSSAFSSASGKVRPIPSASPTARISVPSAVELPGNFAKSKRGALTAT